MSRLTEYILNGKPHYRTSSWGWRTYLNNGRWVTDFHLGCDEGTNGNNWPLYAIEDGEVVAEGWTNSTGWMVRIWYPRILHFLEYYHMQYRSTLRKGNKVKAKTLCGYVGTTGNSTGIHLHWGVKNASGKNIDPDVFAKTYVPPNGAATKGDDDVKFRILKPIATPASSKLLSESGNIGVMQTDGTIQMYNMQAGRIALDYDVNSISDVYAKIKKEMQPGEILVATEK